MYNYNINPFYQVNNYFAYDGGKAHKDGKNPQSSNTLSNNGIETSKDKIIEKLNKNIDPVKNKIIENMIDYDSLDLDALKPYKSQIIQNIKEALSPFPAGYLQILAEQVPPPKIITSYYGTLKNSSNETMGGDYNKFTNILNITYKSNDNIEFIGKLRHEFAHCFDGRIRGGPDCPELTNSSVDNGYDNELCQHFGCLKKNNKPFINEYSEKNSDEYFADAVRAFLNVQGDSNYNPSQPSRLKLRQIDPKMHNYLCRIFGYNPENYTPQKPFIPEKFSGSRQSEGSISGE